MPRRRFVFDAPDRFVADAVGQPGQRAFYLQAAKGRNVVTVAVEKAQVAVLAERLGALLEEIERRGVELPDGTADPTGTGLQQPIIEAFRVGTMTLAWDGQSESVLVEARALAEDEDDEDDEDDDAEVIAVLDDDEDEDGPDLLRVRLEAAAARGFIAHAVEVVAAGRPPCPLCGLPLNPEGHICPRRNGYMH
jgi:uncharacterized repeat protein (TIGR03847 family)